MAYITNRDDEEQNVGLGSSGGGAFAGGGGGSTQAGIQKGTGGSQPWVNIQNYLKANPNDMSGQRNMEASFGSVLGDEDKSIKDKFSTTSGLINQSKSAADASLSAVQSNLGDAKSAFKKEIVDNKNINPYGNAIERARTAANTGGFQEPEFQPVGLSSGIQDQYAQLSNDPFQYLSTQYAKQGLTGGQRALQEQLTRKSTNIPAVTSALSGKYNDLKNYAENESKEISRDIAGTAESYRNKFSDARESVDKYVGNQQDLTNALADRNQWGPMVYPSASVGSSGIFMPDTNNMLTAGKIIDSVDDKLIAEKKRANPTAFDESKYERYNGPGSLYQKALESLFGRYGF